MNVILFNIKNTIMATLETQYKNFLSDNPDSKITFEEWEKIWTSKYVNTVSGIEEYIHNINNWRGSDLSDWDVTLMDGLENEPPYVSDDFQIGPDGAYEHSDREIDVTNTLKQLAIHLMKVPYPMNSCPVTDNFHRQTKWPLLQCPAMQSIALFELLQ
jgi:hypothetical protein